MNYELTFNDMMLVNPDKQLLIWDDSYSRAITLDSYKNARHDKQLGVAPEGYNVRQAFAYFCNENKIDPKGWIELGEDLTKIEDIFSKAEQSNNIYYGSL